MRRLRLVVSYDGTEYRGFQRQPNGETVQSVLEEALSRLLCETVVLRPAGRTDSGVHARGQVVDLRDGGKRELVAVLRGGNAFLPPDVRILSAAEAEPAFDARRWASEKEYRYFLHLSPVPSPFLRRYAWRLPPDLDLGAVAASLARVTGEHDFTSFRGQGCTALHPVRTVLGTALEPAGEGLWAVRVRGTGFLRHMVRNLVGTAVQAGLGKLRPEEMTGILEGRDRSLAGPTAPPQGLFLWSVTYPEGRGGPFSS